MVRAIQYYHSKNLVIIGYDFHSEGGAWRSIHRYFRSAESRGDNVMLIDRRKQGTFRQLLMALLFSPRILINGMGAFHRWEGILACIFRRDILIYLHDTAWMVETYERSHPWKARFFRGIVRNHPVLCVSEQMRSFFKSALGSHNTHVVYEAAALPETPDFSPDFRHIVMVGSIDERKGVSLFSQVASLAEGEMLPWKFHWIGAMASQSLGELNSNVRWWGWQDSALDFIRKADAFFLSSVDDPLPLACLEAMALGKRCTVYRGTGIAELIDRVPGCAVYEKHTPEDALRSLKSAFAEKPDTELLQTIVSEKASLASVAKKIDSLLAR